MDLNKAILYGQLVKAAYGIDPSDLKDRTGTTVDAGLGPHKTKYEVVASIYANDLATDATKPGTIKPVSIGLLLWQSIAGEAVIAIRGTEGIPEWVQDAKFGTKECFFLPEAGATEDGFTDVYKSFAVSSPAGKSVTESVATIFGSKQPNSLTVCGHSLGGALATLQALDAAANSTFKSPTVYTYASRARAMGNLRARTIAWFRIPFASPTGLTSCRNYPSLHLTITLPEYIKSPHSSFFRLRFWSSPIRSANTSWKPTSIFCPSSQAERCCHCGRHAILLGAWLSFGTISGSSFGASSN